MKLKKKRKEKNTNILRKLIKTAIHQLERIFRKLDNGEMNDKIIQEKNLKLIIIKLIIRLHRKNFFY